MTVGFHTYDGASKEESKKAAVAQITDYSADNTVVQIDLGW